MKDITLHAVTMFLGPIGAAGFFGKWQKSRDAGMWMVIVLWLIIGLVEAK